METRQLRKMTQKLRVSGNLEKMRRLKMNGRKKNAGERKKKKRRRK